MLTGRCSLSAGATPIACLNGVTELSCRTALVLAPGSSPESIKQAACDTAVTAWTLHKYKPQAGVSQFLAVLELWVCSGGHAGERREVFKRNKK